MKNVKSGCSKPLVCLDAGHYGKYNQSPVVKDYYESETMWKLHLLLKLQLEKLGMDVVTTRSKQQEDLGLKARGKASKGADLLLSLHSNAADKESVDYVVAYHLYPDDGTKIDEQSKELAGMLAPAVAKLMGIKQGGRIETRKGSGDWNGDGIMNDNYYSVLNGARLVDTPAIILEHSFHTNKAAAQWLMDGDNLVELAKVEAKLIAQYFGLMQMFTMELPVLERGMKGDAVRALQALLVGWGYPLNIDGSFGAKTENAVECYQEDYGLPVDGIVGPKTRAHMEGLG